MISLNFKNRDKLLIAAIVLLIFLNIFRSLSLELDGSSGSNLCNKIDSEVKYFLLYDNNSLHNYLQNKDFNGELELGYVNYLKSNKFDEIYYISAYRFDSDYYEGIIRTWIVNDLENPNLIFETNEEIFISKPTSNYELVDYKNDSTYTTSTECTRVEKFLYEQRN